MILPQSFLESLAADGNISFTVTPSALVNNNGPTSLTLELSYAQVPVVTDTDPPVVESVELSEDGRSLTVQFNDDDLDVIAAENVANYHILQANGDANGDGDAPSEPVVTTLATAAERWPDLVAGRLGSIAAADDPFVARNDAAWKGGAFVYVPKNQKLEEPAQIAAVHHADQAAIGFRTLIVLEEGARDYAAGELVEVLPL